MGKNCMHYAFLFTCSCRDVYRFIVKRNGFDYQEGPVIVTGCLTTLFWDKLWSGECLTHFMRFYRGTGVFSVYDLNTCQCPHFFLMSHLLTA